MSRPRDFAAGFDFAWRARESMNVAAINNDFRRKTIRERCTL